MAYIGNKPAELAVDIDNASVTTEKLANDAVTAAKIVDGTIIADDLNNGIITNSKVSASAAIAASKLAISGGSNITLQSDGTFDLDNTVDVTGGYSVGGTAVVDSSRNAFITSLEVRGSGHLTNRLNLSYNSTSGIATVGPNSTGGNTTFALGTSNSGTYSTKLTVKHDGNVNIDSGGLQIGGSTTIDSSRNMLNVGTFSSTGQLQVTNGSVTLTGGYNVQWGTGYANGDPAIWGNTTASALRFAPTGSTDGVVVEVDNTGLDVAVGGLSVGGTTVIDSSRVGTLTGLSVAAPSLSTNEALYIQNNPASAASNTARLRLAQSSNNAGTVLKLEHNRSNPTGSKMIDATVNHVGTPYNVFSVYGQGRTTVGSYAAANPVGTAINDAQLNVFHPTALGTSTGDNLKLLQVSGHSGNQSALTIRQRRMSDGNTWISDGFSITQDVDNTEAVYTYMYLHDGNVETDNNLGVKGVPSAPLHVHGGGSNPGVIVESNTTTGAWVAMRTGQTSGEHFKVGTNATGFHVYNETDAATRLHISKSGGNVGIGNTDTDYKLSVGDTTNYNYLQIQGANSNVMGGLRFKHHGGGGRTGVAKEWIISRGSDQTQFNAGVSSSSAVGGLVFWAVETGATNVDAMRLKDDGNAIFGYSLSINDPSPQARFVVQGDNTTMGTARFQPDSNKGGSVSHVHYGTTGDWYIRSANPAGTVHLQDATSATGFVKIGQTSVNYPGNGNTTTGITLANTGRISASFNGDHVFNRNSDGILMSWRRSGAEYGSVSISNTSGTTYNTTSDRRLKTDIQPIAGATDTLMAMAPVTHKWKAHPSAPAVYGFIAQDMQALVPEAVSGDPDSDEMMSMDYGRITPVLVAALQDAIKEITALKERVAELEAK